VISLRKYEVVFIVKPMEEEATNEVIAKFENLVKNNGGSIEKVDRWGKRRMAYEIKELNEGFYVLFNITAEPKAIAELDRVMKITDEIVKHMILKVDE
jgi:small subunit ribosomal protein S6